MTVVLAVIVLAVVVGFGFAVFEYWFEARQDLRILDKFDGRDRKMPTDTEVREYEHYLMRKALTRGAK